MLNASVKSSVFNANAEPAMHALFEFRHCYIHDSFRTLGEYLIGILRRVPYDCPCFPAPLVSFWYEEIGPRASKYFPGFKPFERLIKGLISRSRNALGIVAVTLLLPKHITMGTRRAHLVAAAPRIPRGVSPLDARVYSNTEALPGLPAAASSSSCSRASARHASLALCL